MSFAFLVEPGTQLVHLVDCFVDETGPLVVMLLRSGAEVGISDAYGPGPLALRHYPHGSEEPAEKYEVEYDDVDGVEVYRIRTPEGPLLVPARLVPLDPAWDMRRFSR